MQVSLNNSLNPRFGKLSDRMDIANHLLDTEYFSELLQSIGSSFKRDQADELIVTAKQIDFKLEELKLKPNFDVEVIAPIKGRRRKLDRVENRNAFNIALANFYGSIRLDISNYLPLRTGKSLDFWLDSSGLKELKKHFEQGVLNRLSKVFAQNTIQNISETSQPEKVKSQKSAFTSMYLIPDSAFASPRENFDEPIQKRASDYLKSYKQQNSTVRDGKVERVLKELHHPKLVDKVLTIVDQAIQVATKPSK